MMTVVSFFRATRLMPFRICCSPKDPEIAEDDHLVGHRLPRRVVDERDLAILGREAAARRCGRRRTHDRA